MLVVRIERIRIASVLHRTDEALGLAGRAQGRAEVHQRLIEVEHVAMRQHRARHGPRVPFHRVALGRAGADEEAEEAARDVGVEIRRPLAEGEAHDGARRVLADPLERPERRLVRRQLAAVALDRLACDRVEPLRADVVTERPPGLGDVGLRRIRQRAQARLFVQPLLVLRQDAVDLLLLQHDFGPEDVVRVASVPPRQTAPVRPVPLEEPAPEPLTVCRNGYDKFRTRTPRTPRARRTSYNLQALKIYTKTGDRGDTGLFGGTRVSKADPRVAAYGDVDELNASLGLARAMLVAADDQELAGMLERIQRDLFALGARLADPGHKIADRVMKAAVTAADITRLEEWIDALESVLPPLRRFILAGGSQAGAALHLARTICRRAERAMVGLLAGDADAAEPELLIYVNRLSDLLFVMARRAQPRAGAPAIEW